MTSWFLSCTPDSFLKRGQLVDNSSEYLEQIKFDRVASRESVLISLKTFKTFSHLLELPHEKICLLKKTQCENSDVV